MRARLVGVVSLAWGITGCSAAEVSTTDAVETTELTAPAAPSATATLSSQAPRSAAAREVGEGEAMAAFKGAWGEVARQAPAAEKKFAAELDRSLHLKDPPLSAKRLPCREAAAQASRWMSTLSHDFMLAGSLQALRLDGDCWQLQYSGGMKREAAMVLKHPGLELLAAWRIPEG